MRPSARSIVAVAMMDRADMLRTPPGERLAGALATAAMLALLGAGLIWGLAGTQILSLHEAATAVTLDLKPPPPRRPREPPSARAPAHAASPRNRKNVATDVAPPPPVIRLAPPPPVVVAPRAASGMAAQTGASDRPGTGQGAGGRGNGFGGGGDGGDGTGFKPPQQLNTLKYGDLAPDLRARGAQGVAEVIFHVGEDGHVGACSIRVSSGDRALDDGICHAIQSHLRFRPSRDPSGEPIGANVIASHGWIIDREGDAPRSPQT